MNIVLVGYRGTGKSTAGKILHERLGMRYISMDDEIVRRAGMPVPAIVEKFGWPGFRDLESEIARELSQADNVIIDAGGGVIERPENIDALKNNARIFWLKAAVGTIVTRIQGCTERPSLTAGKTFTEEVAEVLEQRSGKYKAAADHEVDTDGLTPEQIAEKIISCWKSPQGGNRQM